jgi:hypothetical protein
MLDYLIRKALYPLINTGQRPRHYPLAGPAGLWGALLVIKEVCEMSFIAVVKENTKYFWKLLQNERNKEIPLVFFNVLDVLDDFMNPGWCQGLE